MKKSAVLLVLACSLMVFGAAPVFAAEADAPPTAKKEAKKKKVEKKTGPKMMMEMSPEQMMAQREMMHGMMLETHEIMMESIKLIEASAMDKETLGKAEELEHRMQALIDRHKAMHDQMMGQMMHHDMMGNGPMQGGGPMMQGGGMMHGGNMPMNPAPEEKKDENKSEPEKK